jgi:hypothetical protein
LESVDRILRQAQECSLHVTVLLDRLGLLSQMGYASSGTGTGVAHRRLLAHPFCELDVALCAQRISTMSPPTHVSCPVARSLVSKNATGLPLSFATFMSPLRTPVTGRNVVRRFPCGALRRCDKRKHQLCHHSPVAGACQSYAAILAAITHEANNFKYS